MRIILLLIMLISCRSQHLKEHITEQCTGHYVFIEEGERKYLDETQSFCSCRTYEFNLDRVGPKDSFQKADFSKCDAIIGYKGKRYTDLTSYLDAVRQMIKDNYEE